MDLKELLNLTKGYEIPMSFCRVNKDWDTIVCFYNYYDQIFPKEDIKAKLYLVFFDKDGQCSNIGWKLINLHGNVQIPASEYVQDFEGLVGCVAVPQIDLQKVAEGKFSLRPIISTGYYVIWSHKNYSNVDISHEWWPLSETNNPAKTFHLPFAPSRGDLKYGLMMFNHSLAGSTQPTIKLRRGKSVVEAKALSRIPPMGSSFVDLESEFPEFKDLLKQGALLVDVSGENLAAPFSVEKNVQSEDFHWHHS